MSAFNTSTSDSRSKIRPSFVPIGEDTSLILEAVPEAIFFLDHDNRILFLNPAAQQLIGRTRDVIGLGFHDLLGCFASGESDAKQCPFTRMMNTGDLVVLPSHVWHREDGTQLELSLSFWPRTQHGVSVGGVVVVHDLTDAMEIQRDVQRAARLAEDAPNPIVEFDSTGAMLYANTGMLDLMAQCGLLEAGIEVMFPTALPAMLKDCLTTNATLLRVEHVVADRVIACRSSL